MIPDQQFRQGSWDDLNDITEDSGSIGKQWCTGQEEQLKIK